jgi:hypothetical protein
LIADHRLGDLGRVLRDVAVRSCGARANLAYANLTGASLHGASLYYANLTGASLHGASLYYANLTGANLTGANLTGASLHDTKLSIIPPIVDDLHKKIFEAVGASGQNLDMSSWHACETTHCRAGWAIALAGVAGKDLETKVGPAAAGALIYWASVGMIPDFYECNDAALADIKECAENEQNQDSEC